MSLPRPGETRQRLRLVRRRFESDLDLRGLRLAGPLQLEEVEVCGNLRLDEAQLHSLEARGLRVHGCLSLDAAHCMGLIRLRGFAVAALRAVSARFGGELQLEGSLQTHLDLTGLQLAGGLELPGLIVGAELSLAGAHVEGWADLSRLQAARLAAHGLQCGSGLELRSARVSAAVSLLDARLVGPLCLRDAELGGDLYLRRLQCSDRLDLVRLRARHVDARGLRVNAAASLAEARIASLDLCEARLDDLELDALQVEGPLQARQAACARLHARHLTAGGCLDLGGARLGALELPDGALGGLQLSAAEIQGPCTLTRVHVRGDADLSARVAGNLDLGQSLWEARLELTPVMQRGCVDLQGARAAHPRPAFSALCGHLPQDPARGLACCKVLQGWLEADNQYAAMDSVILAGHAFRRRLQASRWGGLGAIASGCEWLLLGAGCGYGLRPGRVLVCGLVTVLLTALFCWLQPAAFGGDLSAPEAVLTTLAWASGAPLTTRSPRPDSLPALLPPLLSLAGVLLAALFVGTLTRRLAR